MNRKELRQLGIPGGAAVRLAIRAMARAAQSGLGQQARRDRIREVVAHPEGWRTDGCFGVLAKALLETEPAAAAFVFRERESPAPWRQWGGGVEPEAVGQMEAACRLPITVRGALMPDAHVGYGLPIGGVLAVEGAVIPYAVGVDIACRMKMTVLDLPVSALRDRGDALRQVLESETRFGVGAEFPEPRAHPVMDDDWRVSPVTASLKDKAWRQLGTSGSGNHFVEFGTLTLEREALGLAAGTWLALLSHSGSRGTGNAVAQHYSRLALAGMQGLPRELAHLAWLDLASEAGREYWRAMELMGRYASANHELIHRAVARRLGVQVLLDVENHHNFAWKERHDGRDLVVHRKGATPAGAGALGIIPGSMASPGFLVRGRGNPDALLSAAHGAGRRMSRKAATQRFTWHELKRLLKDRGVTLLSAGIDEAPMAYKDIESVMDAQRDLVEILARFDPKLVKMAPAGERAED